MHYLFIYCHDQHNKQAEYLQLYEKLMNKNYSEATGHTPVEYKKNEKSEIFWSRTIQYQYSRRQNMHSNEWQRKDRKIVYNIIERYNGTLRLVGFNVGELILLKNNPISRRIQQKNLSGYIKELNMIEECWETNLHCV